MGTKKPFPHHQDRGKGFLATTLYQTYPAEVRLAAKYTGVVSKRQPSWKARRRRRDSASSKKQHANENTRSRRAAGAGALIDLDCEKALV